MKTCQTHSPVTTMGWQVQLKLNVFDVDPYGPMGLWAYGPMTIAISY